MATHARPFSFMALYQESVTTLLTYGVGALAGLWGFLKLWDSNKTKRAMQREQNDFDGNSNAIRSLTNQNQSLTVRLDTLQEKFDRLSERMMDMADKVARLPIVEQELIATRAELAEAKADADKQKQLKHRYQNDLVAYEMRYREMVTIVRRLDPAAVIPDRKFEIDEEVIWDDMQNKRLDAAAVRATKQASVAGMDASQFSDKPIK